MMGLKLPHCTFVQPAVREHVYEYVYVDGGAVVETSTYAYV
jgi:hypothetical protein